jgi:predicted DCC family thiol-disulfide oxidoreductase YuxK
MQEGLVLFDGVCNFCNYWVQFALKRNKKKSLKFGSLQGDTAKEILPGFNIDPNVLSSVYLIEKDKIHKESSAALHICKHLDGAWKLLYILIFIPAFLRDPFYKLIARFRYKWFGKKEACMIPTPEQRSRFVD